MFYSPSKDLVRLSTFKTAEIKTIKQRILREKISQEDLSVTQARLNKLKKEYQILQSSDHQELKEVLYKCEVALVELEKEQRDAQRNKKVKDQQLEYLEQLRADLQEKGSLIEQQFQQQIKQKEAFVLKKSMIQEQIILISERLQSALEKCKKQSQIKCELQNMKIELKVRKEVQANNIKSCSLKKVQLLKLIQKQKEKQAELKEIDKNQNRQIEIYHQKIKKCKLQKQIIQQRMLLSDWQKQAASKNNQILQAQEQKILSINQILRSLNESTIKVEKDQFNLQRATKQILQKVNEQQEIKMKLEEQISMTKIQHKLLRQKNQNLKNKMNHIFKNDCDIIKDIVEKKVFPTSEQTIGILQKSISSPLKIDKQNILIWKQKNSIADTNILSNPFKQSNRIY